MKSCDVMWVMNGREDERRKEMKERKERKKGTKDRKNG